MTFDPLFNETISSLCYELSPILFREYFSFFVSCLHKYISTLDHFTAEKNDRIHNQKSIIGKRFNFE